MLTLKATARALQQGEEVRVSHIQHGYRGQARKLARKKYRIGQTVEGNVVLYNPRFGASSVVRDVGDRRAA